MALARPPLTPFNYQLLKVLLILGLSIGLSSRISSRPVASERFDSRGVQRARQRTSKSVARLVCPPPSSLTRVVFLRPTTLTVLA